MVGGDVTRLPLILGSLALIALTAWAFSEPDPTSTFAEGVRADPSEVYNPVTAGEALPDGFRQLLPRDAITPIYEPEFVDAGGVSWPADTQVIGVASGGESKAYPVSFLNGREMVIDEIGGGPILVTW